MLTKVLSVLLASIYRVGENDMRRKLTKAMLDEMIRRTIIEVQQERTLIQDLRMKLKKWLDTLSPEEREIVRRTFKQKNAMEMLRWCGMAQDAVSGKWDNEAFNRKKELAKINKQQQKKQAK